MPQRETIEMRPPKLEAKFDPPSSHLVNQIETENRLVNKIIFCKSHQGENK